MEDRSHRKHHHHHHSKHHKSKKARKDTDRSKLSSQISSSDYFTKNAEFRLWLLERKKIYFEDLSSDQSHKLFKKFVKRWNNGELSDRYMNVSTHSDVDRLARTKHRWNFKNVDALELGMIRDSVESSTNQSYTQSFRRPGPTMPPPPPRAPELPVPPTTNTVTTTERRRERDKLTEGDSEDDERYRRALDRKQRNLYRKTKEATMEELVPKETGREARIEKRRQIGAKMRAAREESPEMRDSDLMGDDGDSFRRMVRQRNARQKQRTERTAAVQNEKVAAYRAKEAARMQSFLTSLGLQDKYKLGEDQG
eukprot:gnl/Trimastix_PCT/2787.p1 GENE.gnl/Trimastix_PCT/2787~~gnl/Trimastix_PCT/2787.p1  ORF type:complete len:310 (-),score=43.92 gnl/Trimastix_PCT/2787:39-968(-)